VSGRLTVPERAVYPLCFRGERRYDYSMENITSYTSPHSGKIYQVVPNTLWRQAWDDQGKAYKKWYTEYNFYRNGERVTFLYSIDENYLFQIFGEIEGVYAAPETSRFD